MSPIDNDLTAIALRHLSEKEIYVREQRDFVKSDQKQAIAKNDI
ncbi:hypothetical protein [Nostoc sp.]